MPKRNAPKADFLLLEKDGIQARILTIRMLGRLEPLQAVDLLIRSLDDHSWQVREAAAQELGKYQNILVVAPLVSKRHDPSWHVRRSVACALGECRQAAAVSPLIAMLNEQDPDVRITVIESLGTCGDASAGQTLIRLLGAKDVRTQRAAAKSLTKLGSPVVELLLTSFPSLSKKEQEKIVRILGDIGDSRATAPLITLLSNSDYKMRRMAAQALGKIGDRDAVESLIAVLEDNYLSVRRSVIRSLGLIGDTRAVEPLFEIVRKGTFEIVLDATEALARIGVSPEFIPGFYEEHSSALRSAHDRHFEEQRRAINAWIDNLPPNRALQVGQIYVMHFNVDVPSNDALATAFGIEELFDTLPFPEQAAQIQVIVLTDDFIVHGNNLLILVVPRAGGSNIVDVSIEPLRNGSGKITALFTSNNRLIQQMQVILEVGYKQDRIARPIFRRTGFEIDTIFKRSPRQNTQSRQNINLVIVKRNADYQFILQHPSGVIKAALNLSESHITGLITRAREELKKIVYTEKFGTYIYQLEETSIPKEVFHDSLLRLARLGFYLFEGIFSAPGNGPDAQNMGKVLREFSRRSPLNIQIVAERFVFPWALLYDQDIFDKNKIDPAHFWGFKHVIELAPEFNNSELVRFEPHITVNDTLDLGFVCNTTIDQDLSRTIVQEQRIFLQAQPDVIVSMHPNCQDLYYLLSNPASTNHLLYFYCHAQSYLPGEKGGVDDSKVIVSDGPVTLFDLKTSAPISSPPLRQAPLVFLNACQSAELSPYLYDGLVPYLVARGVRGVIGTEVDTPIYFAAEFAQEFLARFMAGEAPLGDLLLEMRQKYLFEKNNILGLVYALYSSGEVTVKWKP